MSGNEADANELLQETLMRIARALPEFEGRASVNSWAYRVATNVAIDFLRKKRRGDFVEFGANDDRSTVDEVDRRVLVEMNDCIDGLPPDYRAALVLFNLEGRSVAGTAHILDITVPATEGRLKHTPTRSCDFYATADGRLRCDRWAPGGSGCS